jgi:hypothetical protein
MLGDEPTSGGLVKFHTAHKLTREAGALVSASRRGPQPILTAGQATTTEMARRGAGAASWRMRASGIGRN